MGHGVHLKKMMKEASWGKLKGSEEGKRWGKEYIDSERRGVVFNRTIIGICKGLADKCNQHDRQKHA